MTNPQTRMRARMTRTLQLALLGGTVALALAACAPATTGNPLVDDPNGPAVSGPAQGGGGSGSAVCQAAFPESGLGYSSNPFEAPTVPGDWSAPAGVELCVVYQSSDTTAVLQYTTDLEPDAVLDAWEPLLGGYATERSDGIAGWPILNAYAGDLEFAIQTDGESNTIVVAFQEGDA
ncbi:hypothetical protein H4J02_02165 [Protaetiibacter sp. SSC-01]|uniref:hypothetical protein n=1 Tax=Protaetiibacter sp. SSC-01 TaxID=2759943 RepID=UPI001656E578|nr:hypothetical protein [Protaetiibacter sp. SSC-01]QNO37868.1 hypothetical protein H4J02_02165 [Protaetiibacter sp. SSC-01]